MEIYPITDYEIKIFHGLTNLEKKDGTWYRIEADRPDRDQFIYAVAKYITIWGTVEFDSRDCKRFRWVWPPKTLMLLPKNYFA